MIYLLNYSNDNYQTEYIILNGIIFCIYLVVLMIYLLNYSIDIYIYMKSLHMFLFFNRWGGDNNPLPDGLIYEGVSEQPIRVCDK